MNAVALLKSGHARRAWAPYFILIGALLLTLVATSYVLRTAEAIDRLQFQNSVQRTQNSIRERLETYIELLRAGSALFVTTNGTVSREQFRLYVERLELSRFPGIQGIGFSAHIKPEEKEAFIADARRQGLADFKIWPDDHRAEYHSILYLEPLDARNKAAIGFDMFTEPVRRAAMERARDTGTAAATGRVTLKQEIDEQKQAGFLIYVPVYRGGQIPATVAERQAALIGFIYSPFRADDLLHGIFSNESYRSIDFRIFDGTELLDENVLHHSARAQGTNNSSHNPRYTATTTLDVAGRTWSINFASRPEFDQVSGARLVPLVPIGGVLISILLFGVTWSQARARQAAERAAFELSQSETALREADRRALVEYERLLLRITSLAQALGTARDLVTIFRALRDFAVASVPCIGIFISLYDPRRDVRTAAYAWGDEEEFDVSQLPPMQITREGPNSRAVRTGEIVITDDYQAVLAQPGNKGIKVGVDNGKIPGSSLVVPMSVMNRIVGTVDIQSYNIAAYKEEHSTAIRMAANLAAVAIENVRLFEHENKARMMAEESNRMKDEFLATVSHELRTPLTSIIGWAHLLSSGALDREAAVRAIETIERNAKSQAQIIDDILDVSRIITGKLHFTAEAIELAEVVEQAINAVRPAAEAKQIQLETIFGEQPAPVSGDANRLQQVVWNLLANAVKFTPAGGRVQARLERTSSHVEITISDTGEGIAPEFLPYVFDRFRQADASTTRQHGGLGLGLSIVRHLVELHGGTVQVESLGEGLGASFKVRLPLLGGRTATPPATTARLHPITGSTTQSGNQPQLAGLHVLVVEDEADTRAMIQAILEDRGARVTAVESASEALQAIERQKPDVMVSDIGMPLMDGYELMRKVKEMESARKNIFPAVALTAYARDEDRERSLAAGYQIHLPKPVEPSDLIKAIAQLAGRQSNGTMK